MAVASLDREHVPSLPNKPVLDEVESEHYQQNSDGEDCQDIDTMIPVHRHKEIVQAPKGLRQINF